MDNQTIVSISGLGYSGSGALVDLLKEYEENSVLDKFEFNILYIPDGIMDLNYHLCEGHYRFMSSDVAIRRFKRRIETMKSRFDPITNGCFSKFANDYIDSLIQVQWRGNSYIHQGDQPIVLRYIKYRIAMPLRNKIESILRKRLSVWPDEEMYLSILPEEFETKTKLFMNGTIQAAIENRQTRNIIIDQLFPGDNPSDCMNYISNSKLIIVQRDPRDIYILLKRHLRGRAGFIPVGDVRDFIEYYQRLIPNVSENKKILRICFEDLIYKYEETCARVERFLDISHHVNKNKYFKPTVSVNNTRLFEAEKDYAEDIKIIETELREWLYVFPNNGEQSNLHRTVF